MNNSNIIYLFSFIVFILFLLSCNAKKKKNENALPVTTSYQQAAVDDADEDYDEYEEYIDEDIELIDVPAEYNFLFKGKINNQYELIMKLSVDSFIVSGDYHYSNKKDGMSFKGELKKNKLNMQETYYDSNKKENIPTGYFSGIFSPEKGTVKGTWMSADSTKSYPFELTNYYGADFLASEYTFKSDLSGEEFFKELNVFDIYDKEGKRIQRLSDLEAHPTYNGVILLDVNFDGYLDIALMAELHARTASYMYWVYNPKTKRFDSFPLTDEISALNFDHEKKTLYTSWYTGSDNMGGTTYKIINNKLYRIASDHYQEEYDSDDNIISTNSSTTYYKIEGGESIESTREEEISKDGKTTRQNYKWVNGEWIEIIK